jgi:putative transposase
MYRILDDKTEVKERRNQLSHPVYKKPELLATAPNQVWSWDITKLLGPAKWTYFYLYVILDIFSRYVVGWMVAPAESAALAEKLIKETCEKQRISRDQLTIHADRGSSMKSKGSRRPTAGPTRAMITRTPRLSSRHSSTGRTFQSGSDASRTPGATVRGSSHGITKSIGTSESAC